MAAQRNKANRKIVFRLLVLTVFMFGFGYALVPIYDTLCVAFGLNGKTGITDSQAAAAKGIDETRWVTVQFTSHTANGLPWEFKPVQKSIRVRPGQVMDAVYYAKNKSGRAMVGRATYSVAPSQAAVHFKKTECFCFTNQQLAANESKDMPVRFAIDVDLPKEIHTITLSYSFFNAEKYLSEQEKLKLSEKVNAEVNAQRRI